VKRSPRAAYRHRWVIYTFSRRKRTLHFRRMNSTISKRRRIRFQNVDGRAMFTMVPRYLFLSHHPPFVFSVNVGISLFSRLFVKTDTHRRFCVIRHFGEKTNNGTSLLLLMSFGFAASARAYWVLYELNEEGGPSPRWSGRLAAASWAPTDARSFPPHRRSQPFPSRGRPARQLAAPPLLVLSSPFHRPANPHRGFDGVFASRRRPARACAHRTPAFWNYHRCTVFCP